MAFKTAVLRRSWLFRTPPSLALNPVSYNIGAVLVLKLRGRKHAAFFAPKNSLFSMWRCGRHTQTLVTHHGRRTDVQ